MAPRRRWGLGESAAVVPARNPAPARRGGRRRQTRTRGRRLRWRTRRARSRARGPGTGRYAPWPGGFREAGAALVAGNADLVIMLIGAVDIAGHDRGAASMQYREAALAADRALAHALAKVDLEQDAVIVTADHGHPNRGGTAVSSRKWSPCR